METGNRQVKLYRVVSSVLIVALLGATATAWYFAAQAQTPAQRAEETAEPEDSVITRASPKYIGPGVLSGQGRN